MNRIFSSVVETIGRTPLVRCNRVVNGTQATLLAKCEFFNPLGSVKDRIGRAMIEDAERRGLLKAGNAGKVIVTILPSTGERYLSTPLAAEARAEVGG